MDMVRKGFGNEPLEDLRMERKRVEEFEESLKPKFPSLSKTAGGSFFDCDMTTLTH